MIYAKQVVSGMPESVLEADFKCLDRSGQESLVLVPGWATDYRIFNTLDLKANYLLPLNFHPATFEKSLIKTIKKNNLKKISLFGFSLGGFLAAQFASKYTGLIDNLVLVSMRKRYDRTELAEIKNLLRRNKKAYLYKFYNQCFYNKNRMHWFKDNLLKAYCQEFDLNYLLETLDYLGKCELKPQTLKGINKVTLIHGECDRVAPLKEARDIKGNFKHIKFICISQAGHIPFLEEDLGKYI